MKTITLEENQTVEINGIILTPEVIEQLKMLQKDENEVLKRILSDLAETVCFLTIEAVDYAGTNQSIKGKRLLDLCLDISYYRDWFGSLKKPEK